MTEKDINIEDEETLEEAPVEEAAVESEEAKAEEPAEEKAPLEKAQAEIEELKTQLLYKAAEFDNYRKRTLKERAELILNGGEKVITAILPILDDMERAIENGEKTDDPEVLREGMTLIHQKFMKTLESQGVTKIEANNADFDTDLHEAVAMVPGMGDDKKGKVIDCLQQGYKLNDKVIRHAKVAVGQ
jgi:molecular chaperone GrpE